MKKKRTAPKPAAGRDRTQPELISPARENPSPAPRPLPSVILSAFSARWPVVLLSFVFLSCVYGPSLWGQPFLDDYSAIVKNERIHSLAAIPSLVRAYFYTRGWVQISFALDWALYSGAFWGMHLTNLLLHAAAAGLVWLVTGDVIRLLKDESAAILPAFYRGLPAALLFALHPINTQAVTYVIARADLMATLFFLLGLYFSARGTARLSSETSPERVQWKAVAGIVFSVLLAVGLGVGAKEIVVTLPILVLLMTALAKRNNPVRLVGRDLFLIALPFVLLIAAYLLIRIAVFGAVLGFPDVQARSPWVNLLTQTAAVVLYYFPRLLLPIHLRFDPEFALVESPLDPRFLFSLLVILAGLAVAWRSHRRHPVVTFGILWFFITLAPTSSFIPLWDVLAERRIYLPGIGLAMALEAGVLSLRPRRLPDSRILLGGTVSLFLILGLLTLNRNREYTDPIRFWQKEFAASPTKPRVIRNLLHAYVKENRMDDAKKVFLDLNWETIDLRKSIRRSEDSNFIIRFMLSNNIQLDRAVQLAEALSDRNPSSPDILNTLQIAYLQTRQYDKAETAIARALQIDPRHLDSLLNQAYTASLRKDHAQTLHCLESAVQYHPDSVEALEQLIRYRDYLKMDAAELKTRLGQLKSKQNRLDPTAIYQLN